MAALTATAATAAPAPASAPLTHWAGCFPRKRADRARMTIRPGTMKQNPPIRAPRQPRSRQAQKMANCVDAGPGSRLQAAMPSSNSLGVIHSRSTTHSFRSRAMWVGGPPNPMHPMRPHSRAMVVRRTGSPAACIIKKATQTRRASSHPAASAEGDQAGEVGGRKRLCWAGASTAGQRAPTAALRACPGPRASSPEPYSTPAPARQAAFRYLGGAQTRCLD